MCEAKSTGITPGWMVGRRIARAAARAPQPCTCPQPAPGPTATDQARTVLAWVGGICAASAIGTGALGRALGIGLHVAVIMAGVVLGLAVAGGGWLLWRRVRSLMVPEIRPWRDPPPLPEGTRAIVTHVNGRAVQAAVPVSQAGSIARAGARPRR